MRERMCMLEGERERVCVCVFVCEKRKGLCEKGGGV